MVVFANAQNLCIGVRWPKYLVQHGKHMQLSLWFAKVELENIVVQISYPNPNYFDVAELLGGEDESNWVEYWPPILLQAFEIYRCRKAGRGNYKVLGSITTTKVYNLTTEILIKKINWEENILMSFLVTVLSIKEKNISISFFIKK